MSTSCNMDPTDIMNKIYEIVAILQTLRTLITQLNQMCLNSFFRSLFGMLFFFTPQFNPYIWADAYEKAVQHHEAHTRETAEAKTSGRKTASSTGVDGATEVRKTSGHEYDEYDASPAL